MEDGPGSWQGGVSASKNLGIFLQTEEGEEETQIA